MTSSPSAEYPPHVVMGMPSLSPTMEKGNIVAWKFKPGDAIKPGDVLTDIETDKATMAFENQEDGVLAKILMPDGSKDVPVGAPVAVIVEDATSVPQFADFTAGQPVPQAGAASSAPAAPSPPAAPATAAAGPQPGAAKVVANHRMGPAARMLLQGAGLTAADISAPTGPRDIITKGDVLAAIEAGVKPGSRQPAAAASVPNSQMPPAEASTVAAPESAAPKAAAPKAAATPPSVPPPNGGAPPAAAVGGGEYEDIPNSQIRKIIAQRLLASKVGIPALYLSADVVMDELLGLRKALAARDIKVSVNDFVLKAVAQALKEVPAANVYYHEASGDSQPFKTVDICVAVATDKGLITPIVKGADGKTLTQISAEVKQLAAKAKANKLKPEEFQGGSFTVSNLGMYGVTAFSAIINPPQAAILAVGGSSVKTVLRNGKPASQTVMTVTVSADHRVYDGELAAAFLDAFTRNMQQPMSLVL
ncbi:Lipoate acetyltransferase [Haematococcus lacustris]